MSGEAQPTATVRSVAPQPRGIVLPDDAERMLTALSRLEDANDELVRVVALALNNGASIREVMKVTGMSNARVQRLGHAGGWPTEEFKQKRAEVRRRNAEWEAFMEANPDGPPEA